MHEIVFEDALLEEVISFKDGTHDIEQFDDREPKVVESLFFPGCSFINSSIELMEETFQTLVSDHQIDGITLMCCEKPLDYKDGKQAIKEAFSERLRMSLVRHGVKRIITACPNCFYELRKLVSQDFETENIEIIALPKVLFDCDHLVLASATEVLSPIAIHDACPDRRYGYYAESVRNLFPADLLTELEHNKSRSLCCGSIPRAAGNEERAAKDDIPIYHYLELLFGTRVDWRATPEHLIIRFRYQGIFDEVH